MKLPEKDPVEPIDYVGTGEFPIIGIILFIMFIYCLF